MAAWLLGLAASATAQSGTYSNITEYPVPAAVNYSGGITARPDGALWFTESYANKIGRITIAGVITDDGRLVTRQSFMHIQAPGSPFSGVSCDCVESRIPSDVGAETPLRVAIETQEICHGECT